MMNKDKIIAEWHRLVNVQTKQIDMQAKCISEESVYTRPQSFYD
jgi:hypothetical protein